MLQPPWLSAHFVPRPMFVFPSLPPKPARSAQSLSPVWPTRASSPTSGSHRHRRPFGRATVPCTTVCHSPPCMTSRTETAPHLLNFPHQDSAALSPHPSLTHLKPMRSKTPPMPAASPPPHRLPGPIKRTPISAFPHHTHCSPPLLFSVSPVARHRAPPPLSPPLHRQPHPAIAPVTKAHGEDRKDPLYLSLQPQRAPCPCIVDEPALR
jgi:hypothetical protein